MRRIWLLLVVACFSLWTQGASAAVGCSLNNPDEDIQRFFPEMTSYRVHFVSLKTQNPSGLSLLEKRLQTPLDPVFETDDVPYSLYIVEGDQARLGYVIGANNRGAHSSIQVIAVLDPAGQLLEVYLQRIRSPEAESFRNEHFLRALAEQSLEDFSRQFACFRDGLCDDAIVPDPSEGRASEDYRAILRGLAKLHWLQELLLFPLGGPPPRSLKAQAQWIGNHRGSGLLDPVNHQPTPTMAAPNDHDPLAPVFLWGIGRYGLVWPLDSLERHAALTLHLGDKTLLLARSHSHGSPTLLSLSSPEALRPTRDVLWGDRIFLDAETLSRWSVSLGKSIYGSASGTKLQKLRSGLSLTWREAQASGLILLNAAPDSKPPARSAGLAGDYLLLESPDLPKAWPLSSLAADTLHRHDTWLLARVGESVAVWSQLDREGRKHEMVRESSLFLRDSATESLWSLVSGRALSGPLAGAQLLSAPSQILSEEGLNGLFPDAERISQ